jgi:hypothetical protein
MRVEARRNQQYLVSKKAEYLEQEINYTLKLLPKHMKHYEMLCISGKRGLQKSRKFRRWMVSLSVCVCVCVWCVVCLVCVWCVCVCVCVWCVWCVCVCVWCVCVCVCVCGVLRCTAGSLPGLFRRFVCVSIWYTQAGTLGSNWCALLTPGRDSYVPFWTPNTYR